MSQPATSAPASQPVTTAPAPPQTSQPVADQQRINDLITLIEGPQVPATHRQTGARELLRLNWPAKISRLASILAGTNAAARTAVALALADLPEYLDEAYIDPLMMMLGDADAELRRAAATALTGYRDHGVAARLRGITLDRAQPFVRRLAAVDALGMMTKREAAEALVAALADPNDPICQPALQALEQVTAKDFRGDAKEARAWWKDNADLEPLEWQQAQIDRLIQRDRRLTRRLHELEDRLVEAFRAEYVRATEPEKRAALLQAYLADTSGRVRLLGLDLVQQLQGEGKELSAEITVQLRALLADIEPDVRAAAVQAVSRLRDGADAERFRQLLAAERVVKVRLALVNGLGYIGDATVTELLLAVVANPDDPCLTDAVAALGRLAERGVLADAQRAAVIQALLAVYSRSQPAQAVLRERVLWSMSILADPQFGPSFIAALAEGEATTVRVAAVRGITALKDPQLADHLIPLTRDPDTTLRRAAVEALAGLATTPAHLEALLSRLDPGLETDAAIQAAAWTGVRRVLPARAPAEVESWVAKLPAGMPDRAARIVELLSLVENALSDQPESRGDLGRIRARIAAERAASVPPQETVVAYLAALGDLHAAKSPEITRVATELVRFALVHGCYDEAVATALVNGNPPLDGPALWAGVKGEIESRLNAEHVDEALAMLQAFQAHPPAALPADVTAEIDALLRRAAKIKSPPASAPASQPADNAGG
jgi:HEAT repeat protein